MRALPPSHTHADFPNVCVCSFSSFAKMVRRHCEATAGQAGQHGGAAYFCIWNRKSRRLMFLAASSLLHSTESTMGSGT